MPVRLFDPSSSPNALLQPVGMDEIHLHDQFWQPRRDANARVTIPSQRRFLDETHRIRNFEHAAGTTDAPHVGQRYNDSDVYKWIEAAAWSLVDEPNDVLRQDLEQLAATIRRAQGSDGYLNTYFHGERRAQRFADLADNHEIYCIGHLIQAAIAMHRTTGSAELLGVALGAARCVGERYGNSPGKAKGCCGHPIAEMAMVELARETGDSRWRELARHMLDARGANPPVAGGRQYTQDHVPVAHQRTPVGHAVRQLYLAAGVADLALDGDVPELADANRELWEQFATRKMLITGGAGSRWDDEAFGDDWELPSDRCYAESCAAIAAAQWHHRRWMLTGDPRAVDLLEWTLINAMLPGLSVDGEHYFYQNVLADRGAHRRKPWFGCACCPPNIARALASLSGMVAARSDTMVQIGLIADMTIETHDARIRVSTRYPWDGTVRVRAEGTIREVQIRIPEWASVGTRDGKQVAPGWCRLHLAGGRLDTTLMLPMFARRVFANPRVHATRGQMAIHRGPVLYCAEACDLNGVDPFDLAIGRKPDWTPATRRMGDLEYVALTGRAEVVPQSNPMPWRGSLPECDHHAEIEWLPYFLWANREPGAMSVWFHRQP